MKRSPFGRSVRTFPRGSAVTGPGPYGTELQVVKLPGCSLYSARYGACVLRCVPIHSARVHPGKASGIVALYPACEEL